MFTNLRRRFCSHEVYIEDLKRRSDHQVTTTCILCGKALAATYGLALPAKLLQRPKSLQTPGCRGTACGTTTGEGDKP